MRLYQRENTQGAGLEKNQKSLSWEDSQSSHIPHTIFVYVLYLYLHRVLTSSSTPFLLLCLPSPALSHLNTYAYLIWHGFDFDFGFDFSLCLGGSPRNWQSSVAVACSRIRQQRTTLLIGYLRGNLIKYANFFGSQHSMGS